MGWLKLDEGISPMHKGYVNEAFDYDHCSDGIVIYDQSAY
jgi:hypothetical protein